MSGRIAFIGAGRMASAMVHGILKNGICEAHRITCTGAQDGTAESLAAKTGIHYTYDWNKLLEKANWIVLACKPQQLDELPEKLATLTRGKTIISILAGTRLARLKRVFPDSLNIIRCMPNTPGMVGCGITVYCPLQELDEEDEAQVRNVLKALGEVLKLPEDMLDAVTGVSGSGPAYVFEFVAALRDGGVAAGLEEKVAYRLALKTVQGAAALLEKVPESPETHRDWVSSPGGTTLAGLEVMKNTGFRDILRKTVAAATERSKELSGARDQ